MFQPVYMSNANDCFCASTGAENTHSCTQQSEAGQRFKSSDNFITTTVQSAAGLEEKLDQLFNQELLMKRLCVAILINNGVKCAFHVLFLCSLSSICSPYRLPINNIERSGISEKRVEPSLKENEERGGGRKKTVGPELPPPPPPIPPHPLRLLTLFLPKSL